MPPAPAATDLESLLRLHRHADGIISFAVESENDWRPVFAIRADRLEAMFPEIRAYLLRDSFVSINAAHRMSRRAKGPLGIPCHRTETLRYLCACYCDLDFYRKGLTYAQAIAYVRAAVTNGQLPRYSAIVRSGRGLWVFWLLHDERDPAHAHLGAYSDNPKNHLLLYQQIHRAIRSRMACLGADPAATDAARYVRMPGSFRNDVEAVVFWDWADALPGPTASYTLHQLAQYFGLESSSPRVANVRAGVNPAGPCPGRRRGFDVANRNKLEAFRELQKLRGGGFVEGQRNVAAFILAACLKWNGTSPENAMAQVMSLARACHPPLPLGECFTVVKSAYKPKVRKMSYRWIADQLAVTPQEAQRITDRLHKPFPAAAGDRGGVVDRGGSQRTTNRLVRRLEIQRLVGEAGVVPSCRQLQAMLRQAGIQVGHVTVLTDLRALELNLQGLRKQQQTSLASFDRAHPPLFRCLEHYSSIA